MKIRLMGPPDIVRAWSKALESSFDAQHSEYPCRKSTDIRAYLDIDDRKAAIAFLPEAGEEVPSTESRVQPQTRKRSKSASA